MRHKKRIFSVFGCLRQRSLGFTLVEILITVAVLALLLGFAGFYITNYKSSQDVKLDAQAIEEAIGFAHEKARQGDGGVGWGIHFISLEDGGSYEIFQGSVYATSSVVQKRSLSGATRFTNPAPGSTKTMLFSAITGLPSGGNTIVLRKEPFSDEVYIVTINSLGKISRTLETGLLGMWLLDEGSGTATADASGNGYDGTLQNFSFSGTSNWTASGKTGGALSFGLSSNVVNVGTSIAPTSDMTISAWVYRNSTSGQKIIDKQDTGLITGYTFYFSTANLCLRHGDGSTNGQVCANAGVPTGSWHHVAGTRSGADIIIYKDGVSIGTGTGIEGNIATNEVAAGVGYSIGKSQGGFDGVLDDVRVYNRVLSPDEIKALYEQQ